MKFNAAAAAVSAALLAGSAHADKVEESPVVAAELPAFTVSCASHHPPAFHDSTPATHMFMWHLSIFLRMLTSSLSSM